MKKQKLVVFLARLIMCNGNKLENIEEYTLMKNYLSALNEDEFSEKLIEYGLCEKEAS